ncbi:MAG: NADH-quinone oxidoreductase subunit L, partial [bacterium]
MELRPLIVSLLALAVPATLALAGLVAPRRAGLASAAALGLAALFAGVSGLLGGAGALVRVDAATSTMLLLVGALAAVIVRYSRTCLDGDPRLDHYLRWLLLTLAAITTLVVTSSLLVLAIAWGLASVTLHQLLTWYADRPAALVAAHKKFLVSRLADACLVVALWLVYAEVGSFDLDAIAAFVARGQALPTALEIGAVFLVLAVALRTAQLPFHGWITQVMEAPTPVSALLHAGVVNVGGFVLIRLAPWLGQAGAAQVLLVVIGIVSATVGALVMTTRVSVKVALAWSTIAQLGLMLVQCGLGLWSLALLHLVAHSLYKAHAFLSAGSAVDAWRVTSLRAKSAPASAARVVLASAAALAIA